ncbi:MAG: LytTR family DNA-binding domain-containing protein [Saccharospirillum sp.]|nr:LytTR family DNA-binding domain-containing protein [Saccharospirillum sp.]
MTRILIADDEPLLRFHLQKSLGEVWPEAEVVAQAANGEEALTYIEALQPDVAFLDIHMPGRSGLEVGLACSRQDAAPLIVFLTAFDDYAIKAFDQGAIDYLLKPLDENRLMASVSRLKQRLQRVEETPGLNTDQLLELLAQRSSNHLGWIKAQSGTVIKVIAVEEIDFFKAEDKYTTLYSQGETYLVRLSIKQLEAQLDPQCFCRIHRSTLVNLHCVDKVDRDDLGQMRLYVKGSSKPLAVARAKQSLFKAD